MNDEERLDRLITILADRDRQLENYLNTIGVGADGADGADGAPGADGADGVDGVDGAPGPANLFVQETDPGLTMNGIWVETDGSGNVVTMWIETGF